jgi:hypothetical protein
MVIYTTFHNLTQVHSTHFHISPPLKGEPGELSQGSDRLQAGQTGFYS